MSDLANRKTEREGEAGKLLNVLSGQKENVGWMLTKKKPQNLRQIIKLNNKGEGAKRFKKTIFTALPTVLGYRNTGH